MEEKNYFERRKMSLEELKAYYRKLRKENYEKNTPIKGIKLRKKTYHILRQILKIDQRFNNFSVKVISDERKKTTNPKIYAVTHVARYDIESALYAINEDAFFVMGDPGEIYRSIEYLFLKGLGLIAFDTDVKEDRKISLDTMIKVLKNKGNVLIFPEAAWNITDNEIVMKLFTGVIEAAIRGKAEIIPVAIDKDEQNHYYVKIGKNITTSSMTLENKRKEADQLRDVLASLKWNLWEYLCEKDGLQKRDNLPDNAKEQYIESIMKDSENNYTIEEINRTKFKDKNITTPEEAFEHLGKIKVTKDNAFLFKNMNQQERMDQAKVLIKQR